MLWTTLREPPAEAVNALFDVVRAGTPLYGIHAAPYTVRTIDGGPKAIGGAYQKTFPHLPYQETTVKIYEKDHPVTQGVEDFVITDELYCIDELTPDVTVLAGYDGREAAAPYRQREGQPPDPRHDLAHGWRMQTPRAPLIWSKPLGDGKIVVNALGHDGQAIAHPSFRQVSVQAVRWLLGDRQG